MKNKIITFSLFCILLLTSCDTKPKYTDKQEIEHINKTCNLINNLGEKFNGSYKFNNFTKKVYNQEKVIRYVSENNEMQYEFYKINDEYILKSFYSFSSEKTEESFFGMHNLDLTKNFIPLNYSEYENITTNNTYAMDEYLYYEASYSKIISRYFRNKGYKSLLTYEKDIQGEIIQGLKEKYSLSSLFVSIYTLGNLQIHVIDDSISPYMNETQLLCYRFEVLL